MYTISARNVNDALQLGMQLLHVQGVQTHSRNGDTLEYSGPVTTTYQRPWERVLWDENRDANPFFHFFESLWILAGRNDVAFLNQFNSNIANYSDNGYSFHGAYGHRMRSTQGIDQLRQAVELLLSDTGTRRCVIQLWDARKDLPGRSKDIPCNDLIMFRARGLVLDMTVCNRSNDIVWGAYGANAVHFSVLHEFVSSAVALQMGRYHQVSNSYHVYTDNPYWLYWNEAGAHTRFDDEYDKDSEMSLLPLFNAPKVALEELDMMFTAWEKTNGETLLRPKAPDYSNNALKEIAVPMFEAWQAHKARRYKAALVHAKAIGAEDWSTACVRWLQRRAQKYQGT
jgi:thymidylate synthase